MSRHGEWRPGACDRCHMETMVQQTAMGMLCEECQNEVNDRQRLQENLDWLAEAAGG